MVIENSLKSYLLKAVRNYCLDELRHRRIIDEHIAYELKSDSIDIDTTENYILYSDLCRQLKNALEQLPPQEREVFEMSRLENIKYQEIANRPNIRAAKAAATAEFYSNSDLLDVHNGNTLTTAAYFIYDVKEGKLSDVIKVKDKNYNGAQYI